jgi:mannose-6-phosphate isomerase
MNRLPPLQFAPVFQTYPWGGRRLADWFPTAPPNGPVAEAWLISDEEKHPGRVAGGPLDDCTLAELIQRFGPQLLGQSRLSGGRFPLLLKLLDARELLSIQVHPNDEQAARMRPGTRGKTEAWVILKAEPGSTLYAGLRRGIDRRALEQSLAADRVPELMHVLEPKAGDGVFVPAGAVHAIGAGLMLFEIQQTSDNTFRLHDWGRGRPLHLSEGLECTDFALGPVNPVAPVVDAETPARRERLFDCPYFRLWRVAGNQPFPVGAAGQCRVVVVVEGRGDLIVEREVYSLKPGVAWMLPADNSVAECRPNPTLTILECGLPL